MLLLAVDTATAAVTVALADGDGLLAERTVFDARRHAEELAPGIAACLAEAGAVPADLAEVVVGVGPGPFTGLRVGLVTARVLGLTTGATVYGLCTLDALAYAHTPRGPFVVVTDARRREVYWASYDHDRRRRGGPEVSPPAAVPLDGDVVGPGAFLDPDLFGTPTAPTALVASMLVDAHRSGLYPRLPPDPLYLRRPDARPAGARKRVLPR